MNSMTGWGILVCVVVGLPASEGIMNRIDGEEPAILQVAEAMKQAGYHFGYRLLKLGGTGGDDGGGRREG